MECARLYSNYKDAAKLTVYNICSSTP